MDNRNYNFSRLTGKWESIGRVGHEAEQYITSDPSITIFKLRVFGELLTDEIIRFEGITLIGSENKQFDKLKRLEEEQRLPANILDMLHNIRKLGNRAAHAGIGTPSEAILLLDQASYLADWFVDYYVEGDGTRERKPSIRSFSNVKDNTVHNKTPDLSSILPIMVVLSFIALVGIFIFNGFVFIVVFLLLLMLRKWLKRQGVRTTMLTLFLIGVCSVNLIIYFNEELIGSNSGDDISVSSTETIPSQNVSVKVPLSDYDAKIYMDDKLIAKDLEDDDGYITANVGSKIYVEWTFPWGKLKSTPQQVNEQTESMEFQPKADANLQKHFTNFYNAFAKQCVRSLAKDTENPEFPEFVSGYTDYTCIDVLSRLDNEKLVETGIDFKNSQAEIETPAFADPYLMFMLYAYFKYEAGGDTYTHNNGYRFVYDETKKRWFIKSINYSYGEFKDNPEAVITKFK